MVLHTEEQLRPYEFDGFMLMAHVPLAVVLPETEAQVVTAVKLCAEQGVPIVARGAGTGLSGGAVPHPHGVILSLARLNRILKVDRYARTATVQPGVRNIQVSQAAEPYGLYYAPDPSSQIACTIGAILLKMQVGCIALSMVSRCIMYCVFAALPLMAKFSRWVAMP